MSAAPFQILREGVRGPFVIVCDHASNFIPSELNKLGVAEAELARHIAWDIGAADIARILSERFESPAILSGISRLVIDCNRQLDAPDLIPEVSDGTVIRGNVGLRDEEKQIRIADYFVPYHEAVEAVISENPGATFLSIHTMTDRMNGVFRPWPISLSSYRDRTLVEPLLAALRSAGEFLVGDNEPYDLDPAVDYSTPYHALRRGMAHIQVEFRQDEAADEKGQRLWAGRFAEAIEKAGLLRPGLRTIQ